MRRTSGAPALPGYGTPENIADVVAFLASEGAAHVNGAAWVVDDGITAG